jgi:autophagy-related protein 18
VLEKRTLVHALDTLVHLRTLETPSNPRGLAALAACGTPCLLALPASSASGSLRVYDLAADGGNAVCEVQAHHAQASAPVCRVQA